MRRIALLQWDVADSYSFPEKTERLHRRDDGKSMEDKEKPKTDGKIKWSLEEMRRRAILEQVLEACRAFKVEGLVLPEYGVRPETVNWLFVRMRDRGAEYPKAIWAGSFRVPAGEGRLVGLDEEGNHALGLSADEVFTRASDSSRTNTSGAAVKRPFSSIVPLLYRIPEGRRGHEIDVGGPIGMAYRLKRHPALAFQEIFYPDPDNAWRPLGQSFWGHMHLLTFTAELVCAEMFLHASHANMFALMKEVEALRKRFSIRSEITPEVDLSAEVRDFARSTGFSENEEDRLQRSILIIPAMTSRSADYHLFGQAQHLASGLVTVFANSSHPDSCGGSAFIGLDGWKGVDGKLTPYGEIGPGIFNFGKKEFGPLKERECALVIADVNPLHTTDHKPRPQYQARPLQLIAHLPLIFETQACSDGRNDSNQARAAAAGRKSPSDHPDGRRVRRLASLPFLDDAMTAQSFEGVVCKLWQEAYNSSSSGHYRKLDKFLRVLESFADDPHWLAQRREALLTDPHPHPPGHPPAALVDWIYVEDGWSDKMQKTLQEGPSSPGAWIDSSRLDEEGR